MMVIAAAAVVYFLASNANCSGCSLSEKDDCYWMMRAYPDGATYLVDRKPKPKEGEDCVARQPAVRSAVLFGDPKELADFAQKAGRRICGNVTWECRYDK